MKWRKADEMEKYQSDQSAKYGFIFYTVALLIWSLYSFFTNGDSGWQMTILLIGCAVYFWSRVVFNRKMNKE
ncbi:MULTISPECIES: hypothetical protein [Bacillus]|jgi:low affinity Fe/Cu permease|uniref:PXO1-41 n=1 Tax=Bacillus smithii 7_3_47FAA TaxID=665952 RepID=G9QGT9_9BACI|nr:hypothetical protein [Bacillus smithii]AKP47260.1 pXO1-41 [Bacillus smithii]EHL79576.1 hypothetical protein HMPREF1015_00998 [Bacillus smithii 7_3_47FAA]MED1421578.1 hypothetical protein [Bacillus smithii]MED1457338.1 hypothetical protein [Bacillus smithii]MED4885315.1 hypothetical protein [Bacillus smithii]